MRAPIVPGVLAATVLFGACASDLELPGGVAMNPNRHSPGKYVQSALDIPSSLNDRYYLEQVPWNGIPLSYLWSYDDVAVFPEYSQLSLPEREIVVAVIDTGVDKDHEDIAGRLWLNDGESADALYDNGVDDDRDGYVDDFLGWDFVNDTNNPADDAGHGTHVAGTIAAIGNNAKGIVGVAPWVRLMPLKVCDSRGVCDSSDIRAALAYAVAHGARIVNLSLGGLDQGADAAAFDLAIRAATAAGVVVVAAAGNNAVDASLMTPASATYAVAVAAHRSDGNICSFSNYGWKVDVSAPGCGWTGVSESAGVLSLNSKKCGVLGDQYCSTRNTVGDAYALKMGTSMAAPHVSGLAAVAVAASPSATPLQIRQALLRTARARAAGRKDVDFGMGRLSGTNLVDEARTAPGLKITGPRYGTIAASHAIGVRVETRGEPVRWKLRFRALSGQVLDFELGTGTEIGAGGEVFADTAVDLTQAWEPPSAGTFLVTLEAIAGGRAYYDVTVLGR